MESMLNEEVILMWLCKVKRPASKTDIVEGTGLNKNGLGFSLRALIGKGLVNRISYGTYALTPQGIERGDELKRTYGGETQSDEGQLRFTPSSEGVMLSPTSGKGGTGVEDWDRVLELVSKIKKREGKDKVLNMLKNIINLLE